MDFQENLNSRFRYSIEADGSAYGGETGIRTLDTLRYTRFPSVRLQPLGHLSAPWNLFESNTMTENFGLALASGQLRFDRLAAIARSIEIERCAPHQKTSQGRRILPVHIPAVLNCDQNVGAG